MSITSQMFQILESELTRQLSYSFEVCGNITRPGCGIQQLREGDVLRLVVTMRNGSALPINSIRGIISPTRHARFAHQRVQLSGLAPQSTTQLASLEAEILIAPTDSRFLDKIGTISVTVEPKLEGLLFEQWEKPLFYAQRPAETKPLGVRRLSDGNARAGFGELREQLFGASIPLSKGG